MSESVILNSVVERLQRYSAKYFYLEKYTIESALWDKINNQAIITLDRELQYLIGDEQTIVVEDVPYKWDVSNLNIDTNALNILVETTTKTVLHGVLFSGCLLHMSGVQVNKPIYDIDWNITGYEPYPEATQFINKTYNISQINDYSNTVIALAFPRMRGAKDVYLNLLYYKSFEGVDNLQFDFTNAKVLFYPKEDSGLKRINRLYKNTEYTVDALDRKIIYLPLDEYYCLDTFFNDIEVSNSFLYTSPQIEVGDLNAFYNHASNVISLCNISGNADPVAFLRIEYDGHSQRVPIQSVDDTSATSTISNVKQNYIIKIGIVNIQIPTDQDNTSGFIEQSQYIEGLKVNIHNNIVQVLHGFNVNLGFDDLTYSNQATAQINFDADFSRWEYLPRETIPMFATEMTIQTVYDEKKIARLEKMIIKEPTATGYQMNTYAQAVETVKEYKFNA
jgi:hypothetical protein